MSKWSKQLPEQVAGRAKSLGEAGERWLAELDDMISSLEMRWKVTVTKVLSGGSHAFIGLAESGGGERILKIDLPDNSREGYLRSVKMLEAADGRGYVRLFAFDADMRAVLLERLGETLNRSGISPAGQMQIICAALCDSWQMQADALEQPSESYEWFRMFIPETWEALDRPCSERVIRSAKNAVDSLEHRTQPDKYVPVHGDAHNNNMLRVPGTDEYRFIDPDGILFEKSYDVGVLMREWPDEYEGDAVRKGRERAEFLSRLTGVDSQDIWEWGYLQMVATALVLLQIGQTELGMKMLGIAEKWS